jgi:hypothetical protein
MLRLGGYFSVIREYFYTCQSQLSSRLDQSLWSKFNNQTSLEYVTIANIGGSKNVIELNSPHPPELLFFIL